MWLLRMPPNSSVRVYFTIFYTNASPFILSLPISKVTLSFGSGPKSVIFVTGGRKIFKFGNLDIPAVAEAGLLTCLTLPQPSLIDMQMILIETFLVADSSIFLFL